MITGAGNTVLSWRTPHSIGCRAVNWAAWSLCGLTLALIAGALLLARLNGADADDLLLSIGVVSAGLVGGVVASRRPANPIGWLFVAGAAAFALMAMASEYAMYGLVTRPGSLPGALAFGWLHAVLIVPVVVVMYALIPLVFPNGRLISPRWRAVLWLAIAWAVLETMLTALRPGELQNLPGVANPLGVASLRPVTELVADPSLAVWLAILIGTSASLVVRLRRSGAEERQQVKWLAYAGIGWVLMVLLSFPADALGPVAAMVVEVGIAVSFAGIPVAAGIAILRHRLYDIDVIINRTLVYGVLTVGVATVYVVVVGSLATVFSLRDHLAVSLLSTGLVALLFQPIRERLQRGVNRLMYGERDQPYRVLSRLGERLEATVAPDETLPAVVQTIADSLKLPYVAIGLLHEDGIAVVAATGRPGANPLRLPLVYHGEPVGQLLLSPRAGEGGLSPADRRLLDDVARQAGVAVHAVRLTADLRRSRERLVAAREEERRRLRHDLHDGLGPTLASMSLQLAAVRTLVAHEPEAVEMLTQVKTQMQDAVADIRRLVYGLRPPTLDELGLLGAIREHAARLSQGGLCVTVAASEPLPPLPAAIEVAAYRIILEALTNVARHARAASCVVRLSVIEPRGDGGSWETGPGARSTERVLRVEVVDDGHGVVPNTRAGAGLISMRERAAELGGTVVMERADGGGTRVSARLPFGDDDGG